MELLKKYIKKKGYLVFVFLLTFILPLHSQIFLPITTADNTMHVEKIDPVVRPNGGGSGYFPIILPEESDIVRNTNDYNLFKTTIENASYGDTLYINDDLQIKVPDGSNFTIPDGVTLASGRGKNGSQGALIYTDEIRTNYERYTIINVRNDVEITGLRIRGPDSTSSTANFGNWITGILQYNKSNLVIHNCEIYNWYWVAILLWYSENAIINNNYIHNNQKPSKGYGISHKDYTDSKISYNIFNNNRHSIAGEGDTNTSYSATYNLVLPYGTNHRFDMHGIRDIDPNIVDTCPNYCDPCNYAGNEIEISNNTFLMECDDLTRSIGIRGIPVTMANITNNFFNSDSFYAVRQTLNSDAIDIGGCPDPEPCAWRQGPGAYTNCYYLGNFDVETNHMAVESNSYKTSIYLRQIDWGGDSEGYVIVAPEVQYTSTISFEYGDFNNDGRTDILYQGLVSWSGVSDWEIDSNSYNINSNHVIDFNGDGVEDRLKIVHPTVIWPEGCFP